MSALHRVTCILFFLVFGRNEHEYPFVVFFVLFTRLHTLLRSQTSDFSAKVGGMVGWLIWVVLLALIASTRTMMVAASFLWIACQSRGCRSGMCIILQQCRTLTCESSVLAQNIA